MNLGEIRGVPDTLILPQGVPFLAIVSSGVAINHQSMYAHLKTGRKGRGKQPSAKPGGGANDPGGVVSLSITLMDLSDLDYLMVRCGSGLKTPLGKLK